MAKFGIKGTTGAAIWLAAILLFIPAAISWVCYSWYVFSYGFNLIISPLLNVPHINMWIAGGISVLVGMLFRDMRMKLNILTEKMNWWVLATPFVSHFLLWLLVG